MIPLPSLSSLAGPFKWCLGIVQERTPFIVHAHIGSLPPTILLTITNKTKDLPLHVHGVRIHLGLKGYSYSFTMFPNSSTLIAPKAKQEFFLPFEGTIVSKHYVTKEPPKIDEDGCGPGFDGPADLFKAVARSPAENSWVEIDFNEFRARQVLHGKIQSLFQAIIKMGPPPPTDNGRG